MRAIIQRTAGGPEVLHLEHVPTPTPGPTEVLVRVDATSVNPTDAKTRGRGRFPVGVTTPFILGYDVAGTVEAVGDGVTIHQPGDRIYGMPRFPYPAGAYAEYVTAPGRQLVPIPPGLDTVHAAALPLAGLTAWQSLHDTAHVAPGTRVLIHAGAGGVGHLAIQIAKALGAHVSATSRAEKHDLLRRFGADECIDYTTTDYADLADSMDVVLDPIGGTTTARSVRALRRDGTLIRLPPWTDDDQHTREIAAQQHKKAVRLLVEPDHAGMAALSDLVERGLLAPHVEHTFPLEQASSAHRLIDTNHTTGKITLKVTSPDPPRPLPRTDDAEPAA
ncbi:MAG: NADP-dependent oxidoreductase [Nocardioides sp.]|uniref:quinone oxidoreductase family protein n=1 Tax=Nocardioides sp. TaxID=35761 RepID=UPI0039E252F1